MPQTKIEVSEKIKKWLLEEQNNWISKEIKNPNVFLNILITTDDRNINIILDDTSEKIVFITSMSFTKEQKRALSILPIQQKAIFIPDLLILLYQVGLIARTDNVGIEKMEKIFMEKWVYFDGLSKDKFFDSLIMVLRGIDTFQQYFNRLSFVPSNDKRLV